MLNKNNFSKLIIGSILLTTFFSFTGCNGSISGNSKDLMADGTDISDIKDMGNIGDISKDKEESSQSNNQNNTENDIKNNEQDDTQSELLQIHLPCTSETPNNQEAIIDFSVRVFQNSLDKKENTLISPISILSALSMTANGAKGETLEQMQNVFGITEGQLRSSLSSYQKELSQSENAQLHMANSLWVSNQGDFTVNQEFLQTNQKDYQADIYEAPFDDTTVKDINLWVKEETKGMITHLLDKIPDDTVMYLINALAFEAEWEDKYNEYNVKKHIFTKENGTTQNIFLMRSQEDMYLIDDHATGFIKYYQGRDYAFVALLPNEGVSLNEYISSLTGTRLKAMLEQPKQVSVNIGIPKFESTFDVEMSDILKTMGMVMPFDSSKADFSGIGTSPVGNLFINRVLHKTYISVAEQGTKAGAVTAVEVNAESAMQEPEEPKTVILDRPFVYMIIDCKENVPLFMGSIMQVDYFKCGVK